MQEKEKFGQGLVDLLELAHVNEDRLTMEDIKGYFSDMNLDDQKFELIYNYFENNNITIEKHMHTWSEHDSTPYDSSSQLQEESEDERQLMQMYLDELEDIEVLSGSEEEELSRRLFEGDESVKSRLIEGNLRLVIHIAGEYDHKGVILGDLIQEGNIGLMNGIAQYAAQSNNNFKDTLVMNIKEMIEAAIEEQKHSYLAAHRMADKANILNQGAEELAKELDREATPKELAQRLHMTEEEVKSIMKISLDAISVIPSDEGPSVMDYGSHSHSHNDSCQCGHDH